MKTNKTTAKISSRIMKNLAEQREKANMEAEFHRIVSRTRRPRIW